MKPLIQISSVPMSIEIKSVNAKIERKNNIGQLQISRSKGGLSIKSTPIKLSIDSFEMKNSVVPTAMRSVFQAAQSGKQAAYEATARMAEEGDMLLNIHLNQDNLEQLISQRNERPMAETQMAFSPSEKIEMDWQPADISITYQMDKLNFDMKMADNGFNFTPANIEVTIKEYNRVIIEYVGEPLYVPPSASPTYVPIDVKG